MERECDIFGREIHCSPPQDRIYTKKDIRSARRVVPGKDNYSISRGLGPRDNAKKAVTDLGGMCETVREGDLVAIKANMTGGTPGRSNTFTNIKVLESVIDQVRGCGGKPFVYDSSMVWTDMENPARGAGFFDMGERMDVPVVNLSRENRIKFDFGEGSVMGIDEASQLIKEADVIIDVPVAKTHIMTGITIALKNMYGSLPEMDKAKYHAKGINEVLSEVNKAFSPNLVIVDMTEGCEGGGPLSCQEIDPAPDTVIAATNPVCADSVAAKIMGYSDEQIEGLKHLRLSEEAGIGSRECAASVKERLLGRRHPKDYEWDIVEYKGGLGAVTTDAIAAFTAYPPMIPVIDILSDFGLGWTAYNFGKGMSDIWDFVLSEFQRSAERARNSQEES